MAKILIVEDDLAFGTMIQTWLRKKGFEVERATSVKSALHFFEDNSHWDLVLSDLRLPDHDGLTLLQWLKKHDYTIPFIVMTSYAEVQNAVLAMKSGATDYVAKPFHPDILLEKIQEALKAKNEESDAKILHLLKMKALLLFHKEQRARLTVLQLGYPQRPLIIRMFRNIWKEKAKPPRNCTTSFHLLPLLLCLSSSSEPAEQERNMWLTASTI